MPAEICYAHPFACASPLVGLGIPGLALTVLGLFLVAVRRVAPERLGQVAVLTLGWFLTWSALAITGVLGRFDVRPPPMVALVLGIVAVTVLTVRSPLGRALAELPAWWLVGFQAFRLPLELVMHQAASEGIMPVEMSFSGYNFDIVTGATAIPVALLLRRQPSRGLTLAWNVLGTALLVTIVGIAVAATPLLQAFGPGPHLNTWVMRFPFVTLPAILVLAAAIGHGVLWRKLLGRRPV